MDGPASSHASPDGRGDAPDAAAGDVKQEMTVVAQRTIQALLEAYHRDGDLSAREQLMVELLPMVRALASRYAGRGEPLEDLVQVGAVGMLKAIDRFDVDRGVALSTYAVPTVIGEIRRHFRDRAWALHLPRPVKELSLRLTRLVDELTAELGRPPTVTELAEAADADEEDVLVALDSSNAYSTRSLDAPLESGGEESLRETLGTEESGYVEVEDASLVSAGLDALDERERRIVEMRFFDEMTQSQIAAELGISQMHVSRLLRRSLALMRGRLDDLAPESR
jgi:RNA polymerase sigma-B factor